MNNKKLPPLDKVDEGLISHGTTELSFPKCKHELELITSTQARCRKCPAGWSGPGIAKLVEASLQ